MSVASPHLDICLFQPEIPQNTGNIARLTAATRCRLHLIEPLGFKIDERAVRRAGLDYWPFVDLHVHNDHRELFSSFAPHEIAFLSTKGRGSYDRISSDVRLLVFGRETSGLPQFLHDQYRERFFRIPLFEPGVRSLNLSNAAAIVIYDQLRARGAWNEMEVPNGDP